jgi:hypothetical protein
VVVVAASGNDGWTDAMGTPACGSKVIAVGGVYDSDWAWVKWGCLNSKCKLYMCKDEPAVYDTRFCASNGGPKLDVVAPGMDITSAKLGGDWITMAGTSMATPHVAGLAALLLEKNPSLGPNDIRTLIRANAVDKGASGFDNLYGYGRINAKATWDAADGPTPVCGDGVCNEDRCACQKDCAVPLYETGLCSDGIDNDCDNFTDCADSECTTDIACMCSTFKQPCQANSDCCAGLSCHPVKKYCR